MGTSYELINSVIIPNLGDNKEQRILVAINQCDMAMKGKHWDSAHNRPDAVLTQFLDEKAESVRRRIREGTGVDIQPVYYSAGYKDGSEQQAPYNLSKLLYLIIQHTPKKKSWESFWEGWRGCRKGCRRSSWCCCGIRKRLFQLVLESVQAGRLQKSRH